ncbi:hypothetical protein BGZ83_005634 [Gryganskiella cystojenkinii]|nr:hypothetical protein BGZ83_005634 [Gryganskiella cystojenkinii]
MAKAAAQCPAHATPYRISMQTTSRHSRANSGLLHQEQVDIESRSHVPSLKKESSLHSFLNDNAKTVILFFTGMDKEEFIQVLEERGDKEQSTEYEQAFANYAFLTGVLSLP